MSFTEKARRQVEQDIQTMDAGEAQMALICGFPFFRKQDREVAACRPTLVATRHQRQ